MSDDIHYQKFKAGDVTRLKGQHLFMGRAESAIPSHAKVRVQEREAAWRLPQAETPHVIVEYWDDKKMGYVGSNWVQEDALEPLEADPDELAATIKSIQDLMRGCDGR